MAMRIEPEGGWPPIPQKTARPDRARKPVKERGRQEDPAHLALIRKLPSLLGGEGPVEAAHVRMSDAAMGKRNAGIGAKPSDCWTVPLSAEMHREQHSDGNERWFWERHGVNPLRVAERLFDLSEALRGLGRPEAEIVQALTAVVTKARAEAGK